MRRIGRPARLAARIALAVAFAILPLVGSAASTDALSRWTGGIDLYRSTAFSTQKTWLWCTAADVQIIRNIVDRQADHSPSNQLRYFDYMRAHDRYWMPVKDGTEPSGWAAGLRHYVDGRYRMVQSTSFDGALRSAVTNLRRTGLPVGLLVAHGDHAWVLTGFTATADPARTSHFTVTSVRVTGPLWGLQSRSYGYDMRPDTRLTPAQLRGFFTPWHYARIRMAWEGRWVSIQGIPGTASRASATGAPAPANATTRPPATPHPTATPRPTPTPTATPAATPAPTVGPTRSGAAIAVAPVVEPSSDPAAATSSVALPTAAIATGIGLALVAAVATCIALIAARSRRTVARE